MWSEKMKLSFWNILALIGCFGSIVSYFVNLEKGDAFEFFSAVVCFLICFNYLCFKVLRNGNDDN